MTETAVVSSMIGEVRFADTEEDVRRCWPVFQELRPNIQSEAEFISRWKVQQAEGYRIVYLAPEEQVIAVGGYRPMNNLAWGRIIYLDDLAALTADHGHGYGAAILRFVQEQARSHGYDGVHLDTGYQRQKAHRTYLRNGFELNCHHLAWRASLE